jgi:hypothetical protein
MLILRALGEFWREAAVPTLVCYFEPVFTIRKGGRSRINSYERFGRTVVASGVAIVALAVLAAFLALAALAVLGIYGAALHLVQH